MTSLNLSSDRAAGAGARRLSLRQRRTLMVGAVIIAIIFAAAAYQRVAPDLRLKADGFTHVGTAQGHDVWAKITDGRISVSVPDRHGGDLCSGGGPFNTATIPLCADEINERSVFVAVAPSSTPATIVTTEGAEVPATLIQLPGWKYALAVRVARDNSLLAARLK